MRFQNKYKSYNQLAQVFEEFPLRVLKFKNTKWKRVQKILSFKLPKNILSNKKKKHKLKKFKDHLLVKVNFRTWEKVKDFYQSGRKITNLLFNTFDQAVSNTELRKSILCSKVSCEILNVYRQMLLKPEFRLNILLWRLNIFDSSCQATQAIHDKKILVNDKVVGSNFLLSKGDIIFLKLKCYRHNVNLKKSRLNFSPTDVILSFVEIDYYSSHIVIIKSLENLGHDDLRFIRSESFNLKKIKDYI
jgi:ribosomal protein S4